MLDKLPLLDFKGKRLALDMLGIIVYLDGENVEIAGVICPEDSGIVLKSSRCLFEGNKKVFCYCRRKRSFFLLHKMTMSIRISWSLLTIPHIGS